MYVGSQEHRTLVVPSSLNPKWNASMQFLIKDLKQDVLCLTVLNRDSFSPNGKFSMRWILIIVQPLRNPEECNLHTYVLNPSFE